ncbi:MAG: AAA family ATPase [Pirellulales bacterium]
MSTAEEAIQALREALQFSPDNLPLRIHLAKTLAGLGRSAEAEREYRTALTAAPDRLDLLAGLAEVFSQQGKSGQALVILEDLVRRDGCPPSARVAYARLLWRGGDVPNAVAQYKLAIEHDPTAADEELAGQLGIGAEAAESEVVDGRVRWGEESDAGKYSSPLERPAVRFRDVGGMDALKEEIGLKIIYPLKHAEMYRAYGKPIGGGILMYGPPGCGKTFLARATAGEIEANFISIGINDVLDMWIGNSERNLHEVFEQARANTPCVLFFDEVDALGGRRSDMHGGAGRNIINQFLSEMDGVKSSNDGVLVLAATNAPWHVDSAFRRPGRFDRVLFVPPPDAAGRASILHLLCSNKPTHSIDYDQVARKTDGFSGADLKAVVDLAVESKLRDAMKTGVPKPLETKDLLAAAKSLNPTTREWFSTARNYALYSNQGGVYDDVKKYLNL